MSVGEDDIRNYLDQIKASGVLGRSPRKLLLLEYLIGAETTGQGDTLKAYSIGLDVFDKPTDFDPSSDSSVRVEIGRLRTAIALFEASEFADTTLQIKIPVGTYRPQITRRRDEDPSLNAPETARTRPSRRGPLVAVLCSALAVAVIAFLQWGDMSAPDDNFPIVLSVEDFKGNEQGEEIASIIRSSFSNNPVVKVLNENFASDVDTHFVVRGRVVEEGGASFVSAELADLATNQIFWYHSFELEAGADLSEKIQNELNGELYTRLFGASKRALEQRDPEDLSAAELFILATWVSGPAQNSLDWETSRVSLMLSALEKDPDYGPAHSVLADKYGFLANVTAGWDTPGNRALSQFHRDRAAELSPLDANAMFNVAQSYWHAGRHAESQRMFERVNELDRGNTLARFFSVVVPYWCAPIPDDLLEWAVRFDQNLSGDDPIRWIVLTWIAQLHANRGEYEQGLRVVNEAARIFQVGYTFMARAMLLNKVGDTDAAAEVLIQQQENWPAMGVGHYAKVTMPRMCSEQGNPERILADYREMADAVADRIP